LPEKDSEIIAQGVDRHRTAVRELGLEVIPDLFVGIEVRRVGWEAFDMEPWVTLEKMFECRTPVNTPAIPEDHDVTTQMTQQELEEGGDLDVSDVGEVEVAIETKALALRADGHRGDGRDPVVLMAMIEERCLSARRPGSADRRDQHEAALIQEGQVRAQPADFFLISVHR
jgi:hypothetical protein